MFISKLYKLQGRSRDKALVVTIPANVVQNFGLTKASKLKVSYQDAKLIIDLHPNDSTPAREVAA